MTKRGYETWPDFVQSLRPSHAYIAVPVRPGTEPWARAPLADVAQRAAEAFAETGVLTTLLRSDQAEAGFAPSPDVIGGLVGTLAVHPMTERRHPGSRGVGGWMAPIEELIGEGKIVSGREREGHRICASTTLTVGRQGTRNSSGKER